MVLVLIFLLVLFTFVVFLSFFLLFFLFLFLPSFFELLAIHKQEIVEEYLLELFNGVEYLYSPTSIETSWLQKPQVTIFRVVSAVINRLGENVDLLLDV